jgi:hypothetical protein
VVGYAGFGASRTEGWDFSEIWAFASMILVGGWVIGSWKRTFKGRSVVIELTPFATLADDLRSARSWQQPPSVMARLSVCPLCTWAPEHEVALLMCIMAYRAGRYGHGRRHNSIKSEELLSFPMILLRRIAIQEEGIGCDRAFTELRNR